MTVDPRCAGIVGPPGRGGDDGENTHSPRVRSIDHVVGLQPVVIAGNRVVARPGDTDPNRDAKYRSESAISIVVFDSSIAAISATSVVTGRKPGNSVVAPTADTAMVAIPANMILVKGGGSRPLFTWHALVERLFPVEPYS
jgi:hypothetical protein